MGSESTREKEEKENINKSLKEYLLSRNSCLLEKSRSFYQYGRLLYTKQSRLS